MKIVDPRADAADLKCAAIARNLLDPRKGLEQALDTEKAGRVRLLPRVDVMRGMLKNDEPKL